MRDDTFEYAVVRVVPRVERLEFVNVGVILSYPYDNVLVCAIEPDWNRLKAFAPNADWGRVAAHLETIPHLCAGGATAGAMGHMPQRARFHWLVAPRSTMVQTSPVHSGFCTDPHATLQKLMDEMVRL